MDVSNFKSTVLRLKLYFNQISLKKVPPKLLTKKLKLTLLGRILKGKVVPFSQELSR